MGREMLTRPWRMAGTLSFCAARQRKGRDRHHPVGDDMLKFGLLMESAQAHQKLAETHLTKLLAHTQGLDDVVRDEIRRTLIEEFQALSAESDRAARALIAMKRAANVRAI